MAKTKKKDKLTIDEILESLEVKKTSFAKVSWGESKGTFLVAFLDVSTRNYCENNALSFKSIPNEEVKQKSVPIWEPGNKTAEQIEALPKLDLSKEKAAKKPKQS